jgi:prophage DNA circulation protein
LDLATFERISEPDYLEGLTSRPLGDLRSMRAECQTVEDTVSFLRRLVQGHLDIVRFEQERRAAGQPADLAALVAGLPHLLSEHVLGERTSRVRGLPAPADPTVTDELDAICDATRLAHLPDLDTAELAQLAARRHLVFERLDALAAELTRRYRTGAASVDALLVVETSRGVAPSSAESPAGEEG